MTRQVVCRIKPYIQPFERYLALAELGTLAGHAPIPVDGTQETAAEFAVLSGMNPALLTQRLAYWEHVTCSTGSWPTTQLRREATVNVVRNGIPFDELAARLPFGPEVPVPNRRCLRYGTHGIHEYRGKFFPQLVRALLNMSGVPPRGTIADPMCGSGTTLVEALLSDRTALGLDLNPLSVLMSETKCALLSARPNDLLVSCESVRRRLLSPRPSRSSALPYLSSLPVADQGYLRRWFSREVLTELDLIASAVEGVKPPPVRDLMRLSLSNVLRSVSWQKEDDLRVRKEIRLDADVDPIREFLEEMGRSVRAVLAFRYESRHSKLGSAYVAEGDARSLGQLWSRRRGKVDAIITSPPYATALPYLDTDRLSLIYLKLLTRPDHRRRDQQMIGNREISEKSRASYLDAFLRRKSELPRSVVSLVERIAELNGKATVGFRRRNLPALLAKYFLDMLEVLEEMRGILRPRGCAYMVVGNNHTVAGGTRVDIETSRMLVELARSVGFDALETIPMEMLVSRDIFRKNAVASESVLCLRKP